MMDNSGEVVNGTEVPAGSLREEVSDDVPAMLSEGEFVVPADVVRYVGLEKLMKMRDQAKAGLERMEEMGQMGNAEEVVNPDQQFAQVDDIAFENDINSIMGEVDRESAAMQTQQMFAAGGFVTGTDLSKAVQNPAVDVRYYKHDDGRVMYITHINDKPMTAVPDGFKEVAADEVRQVGKKAEETAAAAGGGAGGAGGAVSSGGDGGGDYDGGFPTASSTGTTGKGTADPMAPFGTYNTMNVNVPTVPTVAKGVLGLVTMNPILTLQAVKEFFVDDRKQAIVNPAYTMAMQQSAQAVASGAASLSGSPFGSMAEAQAVAQHGHMSDQHFQSVIDTVNSQLSPANTSGFSMGTAASTGMATNAAGQTVSNPATIAAQNEAMFGDTGGSFAPSANVGAQEGFDGSPGVSGPAAVGPSGGISEGFDGSPSAPSASVGGQEGFDGSPADGGGGGGGGGGKIICTKLYELGLMDKDVYEADQAYGALVAANDPALMDGYHYWANIVVDWMSGSGVRVIPFVSDAKNGAIMSAWATSWAQEIAMPWAQHMQYEMGQRKDDSKIGKALMTVGGPISRLFANRKERPSTLTAIGCIATFGVLYAFVKVAKLFTK